MRIGNGFIDISSVYEEEATAKITLTEQDKERLRLVYRDAHRLYIEPPTVDNFHDRRKLIHDIFNRLKDVLGEEPDLQRGNK